MPMVIPVIAAFATVAGGLAAAAAATTLIGTIAAYATIAGGVLTGIGALTGSKDLMKIGAVLSIGGGIGTLASGVANAASGAAGAVEGASGAIGEAGSGTAATLDDAASQAAKVSGSGGTVAEGVTEAGEAVQGAAAGAGNMPTGPVTSTTGAPASGSLTGAYETVPQGGEYGDYGSPLGRGAAGTSETLQPGPLGKIAEGAKGFNSGDLESWWQKAQDAGGAVADFVKKNPALVKVGGQMLSSMYGPEAEQIDFQKSIYGRAVKNLNSPIALTYNKPKGA